MSINARLELRPEPLVRRQPQDTSHAYEPAANPKIQAMPMNLARRVASTRIQSGTNCSLTAMMKWRRLAWLSTVEA